MEAVIMDNMLKRDNIEELEIRRRYEELSHLYEGLLRKEEKLRENYSELEKANIIAEEASKSKSKFLANMSHEIRTPMNAIIGITQLLNHTELNNEQKSYLDMLTASSEILMDIINNVLDMSIIESGKLELKMEAFDIKENLDNIVNQLSVIGHRKNIKIMYYIEPFTETKVIGDKLKLNQVLINLINNSIKYTDKGHIFLSVKNLSYKEDKMKYRFSVEDTGIGIEENFKDKIFGVFNKEDLSYAKKYTGAGLGLAISKELVTMMNGDIWYESKKGEGTTFYFNVEFSRNNVMGEEGNKVDLGLSGQPNDKSKDINEVTILVVEDNEINKKLAAAFLSKKDYKNIGASNGKEAIEIYESTNIDLILMDIQMPVLNGFEATKIIRDMEKSTGRHVPIIAMTAYAMNSDKERCFSVGMDDYISKPINSQILYEKIVKYTEGKLS
jgi:signal transduction histidine kinase/ActR/RegA family two-component response regulator